jgi:hypothetical protein
MNGLFKSLLMKNPSFIPALGYNLVCINLGRLAQMVERLPYTQNVGGSIPSAPTSFPDRICFSSYRLSSSSRPSA